MIMKMTTVMMMIVIMVIIITIIIFRIKLVSFMTWRQLIRFSVNYVPQTFSNFAKKANENKVNCSLAHCP